MSCTGDVRTPSPQLPLQSHPHLLHPMGHLRDSLPGPACDTLSVSGRERGVVAGCVHSLAARRICCSGGYVARHGTSRPNGPKHESAAECRASYLLVMNGGL